MKKKTLIAALLIIAALLVVFMPIRMGKYDDGGTTDYTTPLFSVVKWKKLIAIEDENGNITGTVYKKTRVYFFPDNYKSITELWEKEKPSELKFY